MHWKESTIPELDDLLETRVLTPLATGFFFTEGPLWHPAGFYYFVDLRSNRLYRLVPGGEAEVVRETNGANGTTFDLDGNLWRCEAGTSRSVVRMNAAGEDDLVIDRFEGLRLNQPNDIVCKSDGSLYFTDPGLRVPLADRELIYSGVYRIDPGGEVRIIAECEYPNGLAFSADERTLYVANTRWTLYLHAIDLDEAGRMTSRRVFADMSVGPSTVRAVSPGPDGMKVDSAGNVYCTNPDGVRVLDINGRLIGTISCPEIPANLCFGGDDLKTLFVTARTSVYTLRLRVPGLPHPWYARYKP